MKSFIAAAALVATATASKLSVRELSMNLNSSCTTTDSYAKIVNRCSYPVYLWSIAQEMGCDADVGVELKPGAFYWENYQKEVPTGVSIKLSKFNTCGGKDITQLEYKISNKPGYEGNFLDMSFVDCTRNPEDCPGRTDGFYLKSGNQNGKFMSTVNNEHCPIFSVNNAEEAAKVSYINWDDRQTKFCPTAANLELYLCGGEAPGADDNYSAAPASSAAPSTDIKSSSSPKPSSSSAEEAPAPSTTEDAYVVAAAAVTSAPAAPVIKTEVVYVTEYVNKRHAHGRRHQHYHA